MEKEELEDPGELVIPDIDLSGLSTMPGAPQ
jgi:hypothetical protein